MSKTEPPPPAIYRCLTCGREIGTLVNRNGATLLLLPGGLLAWRFAGYCQCGRPFWYREKSPSISKRGTKTYTR